MDASAGHLGRTSRAASLYRILGSAIALAAVALCVRTLIVEWAQIGDALARANLWWVAAAALCSSAGIWCLAVLWQRCLAVFGAPSPLGRTAAWFFGGELGKYLPGGIWPVVGRGELAHRDGVDRSVGYSTTLVSGGLMCIGAAIACALFAPFFGSGNGAALLIVLLVPIGLVVVHPAVFGPILRAVNLASKGRVALAAPAWRRMAGLILLAVPAWLLVGGSAALVSEGLGNGQEPGRVAFAAVAAWIVGFLCLPVPAGAGVRELVFVVICGLPAAPAVAVAAVGRVMFVAIDTVGGLTALIWLRRRRVRTPVDRNVLVVAGDSSE